MRQVDMRGTVESNERAIKTVSSASAAQGEGIVPQQNELRGSGPFLHDDSRDRPAAVFGGQTTLHVGAGRESYVMLPIVPPQR